jgi:hypothetical protein
MICPNCNQESEPERGICSHCGASLGERPGLGCWEVACAIGLVLLCIPFMLAGGCFMFVGVTWGVSGDWTSLVFAAIGLILLGVGGVLIKLLVDITSRRR